MRAQPDLRVPDRDQVGAADDQHLVRARAATAGSGWARPRPTITRSKRVAQRGDRGGERVLAQTRGQLGALHAGEHSEAGTVLQLIAEPPGERPAASGEPDQPAARVEVEVGRDVAAAQVGVDQHDAPARPLPATAASAIATVVLPGAPLPLATAMTRPRASSSSRSAEVRE